VSSGEERILSFTAPVADFSPDFQRVVECQDTVVADYDTLPEEQRRMARAVHSHKGILVPVAYRARLLGGLFVDDPGKRAAFPEQEIQVIEGIAAQAAVAIENARLYEAQSNIATTLQQALLELPAEIPGIRFSHLYRSATEEASVGGDFYDLIQLRDAGYILLIGDVAGHGIEAARLATFVRHAVAAFAEEGKSAEEILADTNDALLRRGVSVFVSVLVGVLSPDRRRLSFCSAGHPNLVLRQQDAAVLLAGAGTAPPLGIFPEWACVMSELDLTSGDVLVFYTDGVTEARNGTAMFGEEGLLRWMQRSRGLPLADLPSALLDEVLSFTAGSLRDDVAILAVEIEGAG
jgi:phosphoserine phosphatase RsbU/P